MKKKTNLSLMILTALAFVATSANASISDLKQFEGAYVATTPNGTLSPECNPVLSIHLGKLSDVRGLQAFGNDMGVESGLFVYSSNDFSRPDSSSSGEWGMVEDVISDHDLQFGFDNRQTGSDANTAYINSNFSWTNENTMHHFVFVNDLAYSNGPSLGRENVTIESSYELKGDVLTQTFEERSVNLLGLAPPQVQSGKCLFRKVSAIPANLNQ